MLFDLWMGYGKLGDGGERGSYLIWGGVGRPESSSTLLTWDPPAPALDIQT